ncbi:MAG: PepSY-associated TM helix domain-containing protein [Pseudomonadota bacterium]
MDSANAARPPQGQVSGESGRAAGKKKKSQRRKLYDLHTWVGFHLTFIMTVVLFTGTIATLSNEIDWLLQHDMRVTPGEQQVSWGEMESAIQNYAPDRNIISITEMGSDYFAYRARVVDVLGNQSFVHVNQWTGEVTGETHTFTVQRFFRDLHRYLFMPNFLGLPIVGSMAIILAISLYTGLKTARNWGTLMTRIRTDKGRRILWGDAHKAAGLWSIWFFAVIIITGVWYLVEFGYGVAGERLALDQPGITAERVEQIGPIIRDRPLDDVVAAAQAAFPEQKISSINYPGSATGVFTVQGYRVNPLLRERANRVFLDPVDLSVVKVQKDNDIAAMSYTNEMADPLHFGTFGGLTTKLIWFVFGVFMTGLSVTGVWLTWRRLKSRAVTKAQFATMPVLLIAGLFFVGYANRFIAAEKPENEQFLAQKQLDSGTDIAIGISEDGDGRADGQYRILLSTNGRPNLKEVTLCADAHCETSAAGRLRQTMSISMNIAPSYAAKADSVSAILTYNDGQQESATWQLPAPTEMASSLKTNTN